MTASASKYLFNSGFELASFVKSSVLLRKSWDVIKSLHAGIVSNVGEGLSWKVHKDPNSGLTIIAFEVVQDSSNLHENLVSSNALGEKIFNHFKFLCTKKAPDFSIDGTAISLLDKNYDQLHQLKSETEVKLLDHHQASQLNNQQHKINSSLSLIVTGHGLGGQIASLFTLLLLGNVGLGKKRPLCITFGSPLIGDKKLEEAISRSSTWSSSFLHVVSYKDPVPKMLNPDTSAYMPFGIFLFCSDTNSTCFENPNSVLELLVSLTDGQNQGFQPLLEYRKIVENLHRKTILKDTTPRGQDLTLRASIYLQLRPAIGFTPNMQQQQQHLVTKIEELENKYIKKKRRLDPSKILNFRKIEMAKLEWYKKDSKDRGIGYYDSFRESNLQCDRDAIQWQKILRNYWIDMVEEAEMKPQTESAAFRTRWLYSGTNCMRMVEPLDIAEYYANGHRDYVAKGRSRHYQVLEEWLKEEKERKKKDEKKKEERKKETTKKNVELILTIDSCFWAHVEEALLLCQQLENVQSSVKEKEEATMKLHEFEEYVYDSLKKYEVSPEIFLMKSSYMRWWNQYKEIKGISVKPELAVFMSNSQHYDQYTKGAYDFP
ncbi:hypothetical protein VNO78_34007 [Psophocarpus tetragonolobus]|uniref:Senescence-associated carboxylesterase 101 n=1 Tax=Psophocarpus tetragonolobus TaxID=3891 RepID=A0AAN9P386_PSOTE